MDQNPEVKLNDFASEELSLAKRQVDTLLGSKEIFDKAKPAKSPLHGRPLKEQILFATTDIEVYRGGSLYIFNRLLDLYNQGVDIDPSMIWLIFDPKREEPHYLHEAKHHNAVMEMLKNPKYSSLIKKGVFDKDLISPEIKMRASWGMSQNKVGFSLNGEIPHEVSAKVLSPIQFDPESLLLYIEAIESIAMAPQSPSFGDYKFVVDIAMILKTHFTSNTFPENKIARINEIQKRILERNHTHYLADYKKHLDELRALEIDTRTDNLTARCYKEKIENGGKEWVTTRREDIEKRVLQLILPTIPKNRVMDPLTPWLST